MSQVFSVTEVRNAIRCPRLFTLGRERGQQVVFPVGSSALGSVFHRIVEAFARAAHDPRPALATLPTGSRPATVEREIRSWLADLLAAQLEAEPSYASMPAEVDDLAEALREFARYLTKSALAPDRTPAESLARFLDSSELSVKASLDLGGTSTGLSGRIDALHSHPSGEVQVVEYKLTDESNESIDRAQVALYRHLLRSTAQIDATPVILRFNPALTETRLAPATADALVEQQLLPLLKDMGTWSVEPSTAPPTRRTDLCPVCPLREPCIAAYSEPLSVRDDPPAGAARPRPEPSGRLGIQPNARPIEPTPPPPVDQAGIQLAEQCRDRVLALLKSQGVSASAPKRPVVGARLIRIEVTAARGKVGSLDQAADHVKHKLHAEHGLKAQYAREGGLRALYVERPIAKVSRLAPLLRREAAFLSARAGRFILGEQIDGSVLVGDLSDSTSCHLLIGGTSGSGKSVLLRTVAASLAHFHSPAAIRFTLIDPKRVTFARMASGLSAHLASPVCFDAEEALPVLWDLVEEMEDRYRQLESAHLDNLDEYNELGVASAPMTRHVVLVDEFQDLLIDKEVRAAFIQVVQRLGSKARAAGIHLILATQRPTKEAIPTQIKANLGGKIALRTASPLESTVILGRAGAEALLGKGDLLADLGQGPIRAQAPLD